MHSGGEEGKEKYLLSAHKPVIATAAAEILPYKDLKKEKSRNLQKFFFLLQHELLSMENFTFRKKKKIQKVKNPCVLMSRLSFENFLS